jgi:tetratricopeptide (TPR) repeat protein
MRRRRTSPRPTVAAESSLPKLGLPPPHPFVGREAEIGQLAKALESAALLVVTGAAGSGKTALARELVARERAKGAAFAQGIAYVRCEEGDVAEAVVARAERALDVIPGGLPRALATAPRCLVLDELHRLSGEAAAKLLGQIVRPGAAGRVLALSRDALPLPREDAGRASLALDGLSPDDARALWQMLEETYGPTPRGAIDGALERSRGVPLALRREFARAHDKKAWEPTALPADQKKVLAAAAVLRVAATPAALGVLVPGADLDEVVPALIAKQLIDVADGGSLEVHDVVRGVVLQALSPTERRAAEAGAAALLDDEDGSAVAWEQVDGAALGLRDPVDRLREAVRHLALAGKLDAAVQRLLTSEALLHRRGAGGEGLGLALQLAAAGAANHGLDVMRARLHARAGRVAAALEVYDSLERELGDKLDRVAPEARVAAAELLLHAGDVEQAAARLKPLIDHIRPEVRIAALVALAATDIERGALGAAKKHLKAADAVDRAKTGGDVRVRAKVVAAQIETLDGRPAQAQQALARAVAQAEGGPASALAAGMLAGALALGGRADEAAEKLAEAERAAREHDALALAEEVRRLRARAQARAGQLREAEAVYRELVLAARERGDELNALRAETELAALLVARGRANEAGRLAAAVAQAAAQRGLSLLAAEARLWRGLAELDERRAPEARDLLRAVSSDEVAPPALRARAERALGRALALLGETVVIPTPQPGDDPLEVELAAAEVLLARGDVQPAAERFRAAAAEAARLGRSAELARATAETARLALASGDRAGALANASRTLTEGVGAGYDRAMAQALLVRAALCRDEGDLPTAREHAHGALAIARAADLSFERYASATAGELCAREAGDMIAAEPLGAQRRSAVATLGPSAHAAADRLLADLGLTPSRPFRVVGCDGSAQYASEIDPVGLKLDKRELVVDGGREVITRQGKTVADLRRRSLLKRLLFLFAGAPSKCFSKEEIVQRVWGVEYHPLRHDAALFTNIMRLRRLLGEGGEDILRVGEGGYRLVPPTDFLFVDKLA